MSDDVSEYLLLFVKSNLRLDAYRLLCFSRKCGDAYGDKPPDLLSAYKVMPSFRSCLKHLLVILFEKELVSEFSHLDLSELEPAVDYISDKITNSDELKQSWDMLLNIIDKSVATVFKEIHSRQRQASPRTSFINSHSDLKFGDVIDKLHNGPRHLRFEILNLLFLSSPLDVAPESLKLKCVYYLHENIKDPYDDIFSLSYLLHIKVMSYRSFRCLKATFKSILHGLIYYCSLSNGHENTKYGSSVYYRIWFLGKLALSSIRIANKPTSKIPENILEDMVSEFLDTLLHSYLSESEMSGYSPLGVISLLDPSSKWSRRLVYFAFSREILFSQCFKRPNFFSTFGNLIYDGLKNPNFPFIDGENFPIMTSIKVVRLSIVQHCLSTLMNVLNHTGSNISVFIDDFSSWRMNIPDLLSLIQTFYRKPDSPSCSDLTYQLLVKTLYLALMQNSELCSHNFYKLLGTITDMKIIVEIIFNLHNCRNLTRTEYLDKFSIFPFGSVPEFQFMSKTSEKKLPNILQSSVLDYMFNGWVDLYDNYSLKLKVVHILQVLLFNRTESSSISHSVVFFKSLVNEYEEFLTESLVTSVHTEQLHYYG